MEGSEKPQLPEVDPWRNNELAVQHRLREAGRRPLGENLKEGLAFSEFALRFVGAACSLDDLLAMKRAADRPQDRLDIKALEIAHGE